MNITQHQLGSCGTGIPAAAGSGSASTYLDTSRPAPARLARNFGASVSHYFSDRFSGKL